MLLLVVAIIVGAVGPKGRVSKPLFTTAAECPTSANCTLTVDEDIPALSPANQYMVITTHLDRPKTVATGGAAALDVAVSYEQPFRLWINGTTASGQVEQLAMGDAHTRTVRCDPHSVTCRTGPLLFLPQLYYTSLHMRLVLEDVLAHWESITPVRQELSLVVNQSYMDAAYTEFQLGWRYLFVALSLITFVCYSAVMMCGTMRTGGDGRSLSASIEQRWVWLLSFLLIWFNDPLYYINYAVRPSFGVSAFSALCTVSFITLLLLYWLVQLHLAVLQPDGTLHWDVEQSSAAQLGLMFWLPKVVLATAFWMATLSLYLWTRYQQLYDASYLVGSSQAKMLNTYFTAFAYTLGGVYLLYALILTLLACRRIRRIRTANRFFILVTFGTIVTLLAGLFAETYTSLRGTVLSFLVVYGAANLYVWLLQAAFLPAKPLTMRNVMLEDSETYTVDTTGVMHASGVEDTGTDVSLDEVRIDTQAGANAGGAGAGTPSTSARASATAGTSLYRTPADNFAIDEDLEDVDAEVAPQAAAARGNRRKHASGKAK